MFHGSYLEDDVTFLLKQIDIEETDIELKETLIQSGNKHYSEMISKEYVPSSKYLEIFHKIFKQNQYKLAKDLYYLASIINSQNNNFTLVSLARAGTSIGVILKRILKKYFDCNVNHYSISIIRDRGIDENALNHILNKEPDRKIVFIDGWTGKGIISKELKKWISLFNEKNKINISTDLYVLSDISGTAEFSSTTEDYLIPSAILNSTISGLVSRSILNDEYISSKEFHGCKFYKEFREHDLSLWFVEQLLKTLHELYNKKLLTYSGENNSNKPDLREKSRIFIEEMTAKYNISHINYLKPGIGETTRVLLRRSPGLIIVRDKSISEVEHILLLAEEKGIKVEEDKSLLYKAVGIVKSAKA